MTGPRRNVRDAGLVAGGASLAARLAERLAAADDLDELLAATAGALAESGAPPRALAARLPGESATWGEADALGAACVVPLGTSGTLAAVPAQGTSEEALRARLVEAAGVVALALGRVRAGADARAARGRTEELLAIMSHDLRSPLGVVFMTANLLRRDLRRAPFVVPGAEGHLETLERAARRIDRLVDDVVELSRLEAGMRALEPAPIAVAPLVARATDEARALALRRGILVEAELTTELPLVHVDGRCMERLLRSFMAHAVQFASEGTTARVALTARPDAVRLLVTTTGTAFSQEELDRVIVRGGTTALGSGLELAIAAGFARAQGGRIEASLEGAVCSLRLELPALEEQRRAVA